MTRLSISIIVGVLCAGMLPLWWINPALALGVQMLIFFGSYRIPTK